jgi:hypothetical protein
MDNPLSCIFLAHLTIVTSFYFVNVFIGPIFLDLVFSFMRSKNEFKGMFHELLAFLKEHVPLSITSIDDFASFIHMPYRDLIMVVFFLFVIHE